MTIEKVSVLIYSHRHGTDVSVYKTNEGAIKAVFEIMAEYKLELEGSGDKEAIAEFEEAVKNNDIGTASEIWAEIVGETFEINEVPLNE
jgi:hypothetical protein